MSYIYNSTLETTLVTGSEWLNHNTMTTHTLLSWQQSIISGSSAPTIDFSDFGHYSFEFNHIQEYETNGFICVFSDYSIINNQIEEERIFMEQIDNPERSQTLNIFLRKVKIKRLL